MSQATVSNQTGLPSPHLRPAGNACCLTRTRAIAAAARHHMVLCLLYDNSNVKATHACESDRRQANTRISWRQCSTSWQHPTRTRTRREEPCHPSCEADHIGPDAPNSLAVLPYQSRTARSRLCDHACGLLGRMHGVPDRAVRATASSSRNVCAFLAWALEKRDVPFALAQVRHPSSWAPSHPLPGPVLLYAAPTSTGAPTPR